MRISVHAHVNVGTWRAAIAWPLHGRAVAAAEDGVVGEALVLVRVVEGEMQAARFLAAAGRFDDEVGDEGEVSELEEVAGDLEVPVVLVDLVADELDAAAGAL